jgi:hypothetical protein
MRLWYTSCRYCGTEVRGNNKLMRICSRCQRNPSRRLGRVNIERAIPSVGFANALPTATTPTNNDRIKCPKCRREVTKRLMGDTSCFMCQIDEKAEVLKSKLIQYPEEIFKQTKLCTNCFEIKPQSEFVLSNRCLDCELLGG